MDVIFGVDVWAQNRTKLTHPRVTYPQNGGGGTNTGIAVRKLAELGFSSGIFAPGWSFEHFPGNGKLVEKAIWEGGPMPTETECSCGDYNNRHKQNWQDAIVLSAREFSAGSRSFFFTDFSGAFQKYGKDSGTDKFLSRLGSQTPLPRPQRLAKQEGDIQLSYHLEDRVIQNEANGHKMNQNRPTPRVLVLSSFRVHNTGTPDVIPSITLPLPGSISSVSGARLLLAEHLPLYKLHMPADGSLTMNVLCTRLLSNEADVDVGFYLKKSSGIQYVAIAGNTSSITINVGTPEEGGAIVSELGFYIHSSVNIQTGTERILQVSSICIANQSAMPNLHSYRIKNIGEAYPPNKPYRLCWEIEQTDPSENRNIDLPHGLRTGPFAFFEITFGSVHVGRAYATEYVVPDEVIFKMKFRDLGITLKGIGFHGEELAKEWSTLR